MSLFVDSSVWYSAADRGERRNPRAIAILSAEARLVTSDHVVVETWLLLRHRLSFNAAQGFWDNLRAGVAEIVPVSAEDLEQAARIKDAFPDQQFSVVDCSSFALMQRLGIRRAASFDDDFVIFRYGPGRRRAFEVLR